MGQLEPRRPSHLSRARRPLPVARATAGVLLIGAGVLLGEVLGLLLCLAGLVLLGSAALGAVRRAQLPEAPADSYGRINPETMQTDVRDLKPGDVVNFQATDYTVERSYDFDEDGSQWSEHQLVAVGDGDDLWLSVEDDDGLQVAVWTRGEADVDPGAKQLTVDGRQYKLVERGRARYSVRELDGPGRSGQAEYVDYETGPHLLSFERYSAGGVWEVSTGELIGEHLLDIYPSGGGA